MKKIILSLIILFSVLILSGCTNTNTNNAPDSLSNPAENQSISFSNLKDAFNSKDSLKCTYEYKDSDNSFQGNIYMKDNKFKTIMGIEGQKINSLFDGTTYYSWMDGQTQGFKMDTQCLKEVSQEGVKTDEFDPSQSFFSMDDFDSAFQVRCEKSNMDLSIPGNIEFQDMCELLKNLTSAFENMNLSQ